MEKIAERDLCTGCGACMAVCGENAITMEMDREGFLYPKIDPALCVHCGRCGRVCAQTRAGAGSFPRSFWAARAKEKELRLLGSSGGMFPLLAAQVIREGGIVFGAALRGDGSVKHIGISRPEDLPRITRTKYVQSELSDVWEEIGSLLGQGRRVLFCGTPCQAAALRAWAGEARRGLLLVDLICYGVPSPGIWRDYVAFLEKRYKGTFRSFAFRDKRGGNGGQTVAVEVGDKTYAYPLHRDPFCRSYFRNINIRPACFRCPYCTPRRVSDITLGDFWGIEGVKPGFDDGMGVSALICHTSEGQRLWESVRDQTQCFPCREEDLANDRQPRLQRPTEMSSRRALYLWLYGRIPFRFWIRLFMSS